MTANEHIQIGNNSYEKVKTFKYLGFLLKNQNSSQEEIKCRLTAGNYSAQTLLSSRLICNNLKIKICKTIIFPVVLYGFETCSLTLTDERRIRVYIIRILCLDL